MATSFGTIGDVKRANHELGHHWFDADTLRFFRSRIGLELYGGRYFISSEAGPDRVRRFTVREAAASGAITTVGGFQSHVSRAAAMAAIRELLAS